MPAQFRAWLSYWACREFDEMQRLKFVSVLCNMSKSYGRQFLPRPRTSIKIFVMGMGIACSGATSSFAAIEVAQQFGECISLPNHISVQVRVLSNVPKATLVTIEPQTEDDWEVLELNSEHAEAAILKQLPLAGDVDLDTITNVTEGFSGADLQARLSDAHLAAVHEHLNSENSNETGKLPLITDALLKSTASKARPSVSESEKHRLYGMYSQFLDSKSRCCSTDAKGKKATLA